jgi:alanine-synthesizing transaminase
VLHPFSASQRLDGVRYDIRGPLNARAVALEAAGKSIAKLNIGNPSIFGFDTPAHIHSAVLEKAKQSEAYIHQQGLLSARTLIADLARQSGVIGVAPEHVFIGNGVSELIDLTLRALINPGDEVLLPAPDYPLWTAAVALNGGVARYYDCLPERGGLPDADQVRSLVNKKTRALVLINPNNPTGAVYPADLLQELVLIAQAHGLVLMSDEIYGGLTFPGHSFQAVAPLVRDTLCISFTGLSKVHRACGYRVGWATLSGALKPSRDYIKALDTLAALRLCSNVMGQWAIEPALTGPDTWSAMCRPGGRLFETRAALLDAVSRSAYLRCVAPAGAIYAFPGVDTTRLPEFDDQQFALDLLEREHVLIVPGSSFNVAYKNHFRITLLPEAAEMRRVLQAMERVLQAMENQQVSAIAQ